MYPGALELCDDAGLVSVPEGFDLVVTTDAIVSGVHFFPEDDPTALGQKLLRVNLSDLAAMGAKPFAYTLTIALPTSIGDSWVERLSIGLKCDQVEFRINLLGGDSVSTSGPIVLSATMFGLVSKGRFLRRSTAEQGDFIFVSGTIGDSALGLRAVRGELDSLADSRHLKALMSRYYLPDPRLELGQRLVGLAHAVIDLSDGLAGDLMHICTASQTGAVVELRCLPLSVAAKTVVEADPALLRIAWAGGDDYELLFTVSKSACAEIALLSDNLNLQLTPIGRICDGHDVKFFDWKGQLVAGLSGWVHY
jgi:thiamine-monophosphate kinase